MEIFYKNIIKANENNIPNILSNIYYDDNSVFNGGYKDSNGLAEQYATLTRLMQCAAGYFCKQSKYYKDQEVFEVMKGFISYYFNTVRDNGTGDCLISDFFTSPSFECINTARTYRIFEKYAVNHEKNMQKDIYKMLEIMGEGLLNGGHRTPNHRWMIAAAASMVFNITGRSELKNLAESYLNEGIDIDKYGEFTERSPGMYNEVNDNALFILAEELKIDKIYDYLKANMDLLFKYIEPDGTLFTQNSARKDKGETEPGMKFLPTRYLYIYLQGAYKMKEERYASFANRIMEDAVECLEDIPDILWLYMLYDDLKAFKPKIKQMSNCYEMYNSSSNIYRKRVDDFSISVIGNNANFLFMQKGDLKLYMRICASFFMRGQFIPKRIEKNNNEITLAFNASDFYRKPFKQKPDTHVWNDMEHSKRDTCNHVKLNYKVKVKVIENGADITIKVDGCDRVPFKVEFVVTGNSDIKGESFDVKGIPGNSVIPHQGMVNIKYKKDSVKIGPAFKKHNYTSNMRGSVSQSKNGYTVYFTDYTTIDKNIKIKCN